MQPPPTLLPLSTPPNLDTDTKFILKTEWMDSRLTDGQTDQSPLLVRNLKVEKLEIELFSHETSG